MKLGVRIPSINRMVKARTTDKLKRAVNKSIIPMYGKKSTGIFKNPKKLYITRYIIKPHLVFLIY